MIPSDHILLGRKGEKIDRLYLLNKGDTILEKNLFLGKLEVDVVVEEDNEIVFVEVKTRKNTDFGNPEDYVDSKKEDNLVKASDAYMNMHELDLPYRIDIISILLDQETFQIKHFENAGEWFGLN